LTCALASRVVALVKRGPRVVEAPVEDEVDEEADEVDEEANEEEADEDELEDEAGDEEDEELESGKRGRECCKRKWGRCIKWMAPNGKCR